MYHCHLHICLIGAESRLWGPVRTATAALPGQYSCSFAESEAPSGAALAGAGLVLADLRGLAGPQLCAAAQGLSEEKPADAALILLVEPAGAEALFAAGCAADDIWLPPFTEASVSWRYSRWLHSFAERMDARQTSHFFESAINHTPNLIWFKDKNGIHEKVNDSFCAAVNKTKEQVQGQGHAYIWDVEQDDPACIESERIVMETHKTLVSEEQIQTGSGPRLLTTYKSPLYDLDGSVMGTVGIAIDITRERAYEKELLQKSKTLETIFTTLDCGVLCHTVDGKILSINRAALDILGYESQEELQEDGFHMVARSVLEDDKPALRDAIWRLQNLNDSVSIEYRVRHKDGQILHVTGTVKLLEENGVRFYQRFLLDVTEQRLQEDRERRETERYHRELIEALSMDYSLVCQYNLDTEEGTLLRVHECPYSILGSIFTDETPIHESFETYINTCVYQEDRDRLRQIFSTEELDRQLAGGEAYYVNYRTLCGGRIRYFEAKAVRAGEWPKTRAMVLGLRCVDEETRREREQKAALEDALAQAKRANAAKTIFLSNMSHDIRTPMNAIIGFTTLAAAHPERTEQVGEYLQKIMASGNHLLNLINDVLDMSHIESGKILLEEKPCSLPGLLNDLYNILQVDARTKGQQLRFETVGVQDERVECDRLRLNQVLLNLVSNAVKYTPAGGSITVTLTQRPGPDSGIALYEFRVQDTGIGMSEAFLARIFEPFERERNSTISGIQGTGLGMAITKNLVDMMHGEISIQSRQGEGTLAVVCLPFRPCRELQPEETGAAGLISQLEKGPRSGRILLVEDNELNQEIAVAILEDAGFTVEVADNGQIAVETVRNSRPGWFQLILMDIQMPVMNGYQAAEAIRALDDPALARLPIIAMTANAFEEDKQEALRHGMDGHIAKPIDAGLLLRTLDGLGAAWEQA